MIKYLFIILALMNSNAYADFNTGDTFGKGFIIQNGGTTLTGGGRTLNFASGVTVSGGVYNIPTGSGGGGSGSPANPLNSVQYNGSGSFAGSSNFVFNGTDVGIGTTLSTNLLDVGGGAAIGKAYAGYQAAPSNGLLVAGNVSIGSTSNFGTLTVATSPLNNFIVDKNLAQVTINGWSFVDSGNNSFTQTLNADAGVVRISGGASDNLNFTTSNTEYLMDTSNTGGGDLRIGTASTDRVDISNGGNVGIGSIVPGQLLDVAGTVRMTGFNLSTSPSSGFVLTSDASGNGTWQAGGGGAGTNYWTLTAAAGNVGISTANTVGIGTTAGIGAGLVVMNGNVGIGTWNPGTLFSVAGSVKFGAQTGSNNFTVDGAGNTVVGTGTLTVGSRIIAILLAGGSGTNSNLSMESTSGAGTTDSIDLKTGSQVSRIHIDTVGNVGIGTTTTSGALVVMNGNVGIGTFNPSQKLIVNGNLVVGGVSDVQGTALYVTGSGYFTSTVTAATSSAGAIQYLGNFLNGGTSTATGVGITLGNNDGSFGEANTGRISTVVTNANGSGTQTGDMFFSTINTGSNTEKMRITGAGNVGIGTSLPSALLNIKSTTGIGWSVKTGANTACNTTCPSTSACVMGFDTGLAGSDMVGCADTTADSCLCAGP